jgi:hypothetical protein
MACALLPALTALTPHLARSHQFDKRLEFVVGHIGADSSQTTGYIFAHHVLAERMELGHGVVRVLL